MDRPPGDRKPGNRKGLVAVLLLGVVAGMAGLSLASVPLYRMFCAATGFGGTTQRAAAVPDMVSGAIVTVRFDADTANDLGWDFRPLQREIRVHPGERHEVSYRAINLTNAPVTGTATFNVTPAKTGIYFDKLQCFCFTEQTLKPGESKDMGVAFFVDPDMLTDPGTSEIRTITLSYTMFRARQPDRPSAAANPPVPLPAVN